MQCNGVSGKHRTEQPVRATRLRAFWPLLLVLAGAAQAAGDPVRGYQLYHETPGGRSCSNSACHGSNPSDNRNNILQAANNPQAIADAIAANKGGMGFYADILTQTDLNDLAAYIGDPAAGAGPSASVSPTSLSFATTSVGQISAAKTVTVSNRGNSTLTLGTISSSLADFPISGGTCHSGDTVAIGASCTIQVSFSPSTTGGRSGTLTINHNAANSPSSVALSGTGASAPGGQLSVNQVSLVFPPTIEGQTSASEDVRVSNTGSASLAFDSIAITGAQASDFEIVSSNSACTEGASLAAGTDCTVSVWFQPTANTGTRNASLQINAGAAGTATVALSGPAVGSASAGASFTPAALDFGTVQVSTTSTAQFLTLSNTGVLELQISSITVSSAEFRFDSACPDTLPTGSHCDIAVQITPASTGTRRGTLTLASNAPDSPLQATLTGTGSSTAPVAELAWSPATGLQFPDTEAGTQSDTQSLDLINQGTAPATLGAATLGGSQSAEFLIVNNGCSTGTTLDVGAGCTIQIAFAPSAAGSRTGTLSIASNANAPEAPLLGTGVAPAQPSITLSPAAMVLVPANDGSLQPQALTIRNEGAGVLEVLAVSGTTEIEIQVPGTDTASCTDIPFTLEPGASCTVVVAAAVDGPVRATVTVDSNDPAGARTVSVTGDPLGNEGAGGCSIGRPGQPFDPLWPLLTLGAALTLIWRRRRPPSL